MLLLIFESVIIWFIVNQLTNRYDPEHFTVHQTYKLRHITSSCTSKQFVIHQMSYKLYTIKCIGMAAYSALKE